MPSNQINITTADNPNNVVTVLSDDRVIDIKNGRDISTINVSQTESATVLVGTLSAQGPKGDMGPQGPPGNPGDADLSSLATTGSNVFRGNQTITGSVNITGSLTVNTVNVGQNTLNFIDENGIIVNSLSIPSGSTNITISTGSIQTSPESFFSGSFTGSFSGNLIGTATTASYISPAFISASAAAAGFGIGGGDTTGLVTTGSFNSFTSSINAFTQSILDWTGSVITNSQTGSMLSPYLLSSQTSSFVTDNQTGSFVTTSSFNNFTSSINNFTQSILSWTGSVVTNSKTSSFATTGSNTFRGNQTITGSTTITGSLIVTGSTNIFAATGTTIFSSNADTLTITGSLIITGSSIMTGSLNVTSGITGSFSGSVFGYVPNSATSSFVKNNQTGSFVLNSQTGSFATTESFNNFTSSINHFTQSILDWTGSVVSNEIFNSFTQSYNTGSFSGSLVGTADTASYYVETDPIYISERGKYLTTGSTDTTQTIVGSLIIDQNLTVLGSQSVQYVTSSQLNISTNIITVNTGTPTIRFGGLSIIDSGSIPQGSGSFLYDSVQDEFIFVHKGNGTNVTSSHFLVGPETYDDLGNEIYIPANTILKAVGNEHVTSSNITDTGNLVSINSNTDITGRLNVTAGITGSFNGNLVGTASWADSASNTINSQTASYINANNVFGTVANAINAETASYITGSVFDDNNLVLSSSYALTASFALNGGGGGGSPFFYQSIAPSTGSQPITGSMWVNSDTGVEYNLIYDGNSYQWVQQTLPVGPQGPQGISGTNNIDGLTTTTLVGLLSGDGLNVSATTVSQSLGYVPEDVANKSTDTTLSANSDTLYPSQKAVKTYVDTNGNFADEVDYAVLMQQRSFFNI